MVIESEALVGGELMIRSRSDAAWLPRVSGHGHRTDCPAMPGRGGPVDVERALRGSNAAAVDLEQGRPRTGGAKASRDRPARQRPVGPVGAGGPERNRGRDP